MSGPKRPSDEQELPAFFDDLSDLDVDVKLKPAAPSDDFHDEGDQRLDDGESTQPPPQRDVGWDTR